MKSWLRSRLLIVTCLIIVVPNILFLFQPNKNLQEFLKGDQNSPTDPNMAVNAKPLLIRQYANISKEFIEDTFPTNVSFTLAEGFTSKNITINYEGVSQKKDWVTNGEFNTDPNGWTYRTNAPSKYEDRGYQSGYVAFRVTSASKLKGEYGYYEQNITIQDALRSTSAMLSFDYYYSWTTYPDNASLFMSVIIGGIEKNKSILLSDIVKREWVNMKMIYDPVVCGQSLPGVATIRFGIYTNGDCSMITWSDLRLDNIMFHLWTEPNENGIIRAYDNEFSQIYTYYSTDYGKGYSFIDMVRTRNPADDVIFTVFQNITNNLDFLIDSIIIKSFAIREFNSSFSGVSGSQYSLGDQINWQIEFSIPSIPINYESWLTIKKPHDWSFVHILDGYGADQIENCLEVDFGSTLLTIPLGVLGPGLWKLEAISQNYVVESYLSVWKNNQFENSSIFTNGDRFIIKARINNSIPLLNSQINCSIFYPNASILWQGSQEPASHVVSFGNFTVGRNMTVGKYIIQIKWINDQDISSTDRVGFKQLDFTVWHHSNLTAVTSFYEIITGDPLLVKVKLTDTDLNSSIAFASLSYNSTFGKSGNMLYQGSGIYLADIDTSSLDLGDYYISVNATMDYYANQSIRDLIHIKVIAQPLELEFPYHIINAMANSYVVCQVNVTGAISGDLIWPVNLSTNWQNPYSVTDHYNGTYSLNFSTWNLPTQGIIETFSIAISANKTNYGDATRFITITIYPIQAIINVDNSVVTANMSDIVDIHVNYSVEGSGKLILGANCSVDWLSLYEVIPNTYGFTVRLNTVNLTIDTYNALIKLEKPGFETVYTTITVIINSMEFIVDTIDFKDSIEAFVGETIVIRINITDPITGAVIDDATVFYQWEFDADYFEPIGDGIYQLELHLLENFNGNHKMTLTISKEGSIYLNTKCSFIISVREEIVPQSNKLVWFIVYALLALIGIFGIIGARTYIILPHKRKKEAELLAKTQCYKDVMNIEAIIISHRESGIQLFSKSYYLLKNYQNELLSGFVQAITLLSDQILGKEKIEQISIKSDGLNGTEKIIELDFKYFNFFISDYKDIRIVFILKEKASEEFKNRTAKFLSSMDIIVSDKLKAWNGDLKVFNTNVPPLLEKHFHLYYRKEFKINPVINISQLLKEEEFSKIERRLINVIVSMTKEQENFYLQDAVGTVHEKNYDKVIEALEALIEKQILISSLQRILK